MKKKKTTLLLCLPRAQLGSWHATLRHTRGSENRLFSPPQQLYTTSHSNHYAPTFLVWRLSVHISDQAPNIQTNL